MVYTLSMPMFGAVVDRGVSPLIVFLLGQVTLAFSVFWLGKYVFVVRLFCSAVHNLFRPILSLSFRISPSLHLFIYLSIYLSQKDQFPHPIRLMSDLSRYKFSSKLPIMFVVVVVTFVYVLC